MPARKLAAGEKFPVMTVPQLGGGTLDLGTPRDGHDWQLIIVYRGLHCPICTRYLNGLNPLVSEFGKIGVDVVVVSGDPEDKAAQHMERVEPQFSVGYGLTVEQMQQLGLYISQPRSPEETDRPFSEPAMFTVNGDGDIQIVDITNAPFIRPELDLLLGGMQFIKDPENNYPIRGTYRD